MARVLYLQASPRRERSYSIAVSDAFVKSYAQCHPEDEVETVDLFEADLPAFDGSAVNAKYAVMHGREQTDEVEHRGIAIGVEIRDDMTGLHLFRGLVAGIRSS